MLFHRPLCPPFGSGYPTTTLRSGAGFSLMGRMDEVVEHPSKIPLCGYSAKSIYVKMLYLVYVYVYMCGVRMYLSRAYLYTLYIVYLYIYSITLYIHRHAPGHIHIYFPEQPQPHPRVTPLPRERSRCGPGRSERGGNGPRTPLPDPAPPRRQPRVAGGEPERNSCCRQGVRVCRSGDGCCCAACRGRRGAS